MKIYVILSLLGQAYANNYSVLMTKITDLERRVDSLEAPGENSSTFYYNKALF